MTSPLSIAVIGLGGIGSAFAFQLARSGGHNVTAVARPDSARLKQLQLDNGIVTTKGERSNVRIADTLDERTPYDLVIVTLLAHQVDAVLPALTNSAAKSILFMFNNFEPERLRTAVGAERCVFGMPFIQSSLDNDGRLNAVIGAGGQKSKLGLQRWVNVFAAAGLPAALETNMPLWLRCHVPMCVAFESVSVAGMRRGGGATWTQAVIVARGMRESFALIQRLGYQLYPPDKARHYRNSVWKTAGMLWFISRIRSFRELLATGASECHALIDVMVAAAPQAKQPIAVRKILAMKPSDDLAKN